MIKETWRLSPWLRMHPGIRPPIRGWGLPGSRILAADGAEVLLREHGNFMGNRTKRMLGVLGKSPSMSENLGRKQNKEQKSNEKII